MRQKFTIPFRLPSLNEYVAANRRNPYAGASFKKKTEQGIVEAIMAAKWQGKLVPVTEQCEILIDFFEATKRRDIDNIQSATKYVLDALQETGILPNDNRKWVRQVYHRVFDAEQDSVVVYLFTGTVKLKLEEENTDGG